MNPKQLRFNRKWNDEVPPTSELPSTSSKVQLDYAASFIDFYEDQNQQDFSEDNFESCEPSQSNHNHSNVLETFQNERGIPGLDLVPENTPKPEADENEQPYHQSDQVEIPKEPPPIASFKPAFGRHTIKDIKELLYEPGRSQRPKRILILIRGAPGSGKSYLANLIKEEEIKMGNSQCLSLSVNQLLDQGDQRQEDLLLALRKAINSVDFITIEIEGGRLLYYNKFVHIATTLAQSPFQCYGIEIFQKREICLRYNRNGCAVKKIDEIVRDLSNFHTTLVTLLDPTSLLKSGNEEPAVLSSIPPQHLNKFAQEVTKLLHNSSVLNILQSQLNPNNLKPLLEQPTAAPLPDFDRMDGNIRTKRSINQPQTSKFFSDSSKQGNFADCPTFNPLKIIDHKHVHRPTFTELLMEFKVFKVVEYAHKTTESLQKFIEDVDTDKIIEKRKAVAQRRKILEYLKNAKNPAETVSNPKYPNNWEVIPRERPPRRNKRMKKLTAKIRRVKSAFDQDWMVKGYEVTMDYEEISSDDSMKSDDEWIDPNISTLPDFNHFKHKNVVKIHDVLWNSEANQFQRIMIILRGPKGSGKSHLAALIRQKETSFGRSGVRIASKSIFNDPEEDRDEPLLENYQAQLVKFIERTMTENRHNIIIVDDENIEMSIYEQLHVLGTQHNFTVYTIELFQTLSLCVSQNKSQNVSEDEIKMSIEEFERNPTPENHILLNPTKLYVDFNCCENPALKENEIATGKADSTTSNLDETLSMLPEIPVEDEITFGPLKKVLVESKWDDQDCQEDSGIARLDGTTKKTFVRVSMAEYLQTENKWTMRPSTNAKKRVRWADIEEKAAQQQLREIGFVVGLTDWTRLTDASDGKNALEQTKFIETRKKWSEAVGTGVVFDVKVKIEVDKTEMITKFSSRMFQK